MNGDVRDVKVFVEHAGNMVNLAVGNENRWLSPSEALKVSNDLQDAVDQLDGVRQS